MKRLLISLAIVTVLVAIMAVPVMADDITASVTVNTFASVTITDEGDAGLLFGSLDPGTVKQAETETPSMTVTTSSENNVDITISISGTDFSDGGSPANTFGIANAYYNTTSDAGTAVAMSTTPTAMARVALLFFLLNSNTS